MFDVRIVNVDHYMATPFRGLDPVYSDFRGTSVSQVPIIRIFGSTESGKKTCLHIHGVLPYIYVPFDGESDPNQQMYQLAASLDKALNIALGTANSARQHIYKVVHVKGVPFYGYHEKSHQFLKIYFYNPLIVKKATDLLQNGAVCNKIFQCHEAHLPFILQFFIDYNLHGMSFIQLSSVDIRKESGSMHSNLECDVRLAKTTYCELEVDGLASDILNRKTVSEGEVANPGLAGIWSEERLRNEADASQLSEKQSQQRTANNKTLSEVLLRQRLREALNELSGKISGGSVSTVLYPIESTPGDDIHDASMVACNICTDHESSTCVPKLDDSVIDEQLVLSLSQAPVNIQDLSLLDMMQGLAERGAESYENEGAGEGEGDEWVSAKSGSALLSQSFHCSNMEADSVLGMMQPAVDSLADHTTQKEDCWQDSVWNGMDLDDIPQLDGAPDECDEEGDVPSSRRQTRQSLKSNADMMRKESPMSKTAVRVSSPISINSSEDDSYMSCTPMNIFNQERFWCSKKENADSDLEESLFDDRMTPVTFLKPDVFDDGINSCENTASTYDNVLMHGDPSLNSLAEAVTEVNDIELNDNKKSELTETGLETLEENSLDSDISSDFCLQLKEDSDGVVTSPEFIFNLDYDYSSIDNNEGCGENNEAVNKKKPKKDNKGAGNSTNDHGTSKNNKPSSSKREKNPPNNSNKVENVVCNEKQIIDIELEQENIELNNNRKKKHCKNENINEEGASDCDGVTATEHRKSKMSCKTNKKSSKSSEKSQVTHVISESPSKKQKKNRISGEIVNGEGLKSKNSLKETAHNIDKNSESPSKNQKKASSDVEPMNKKNSSVNKNVGNNGTKTVKDYSVEEEDDDDDDLFRINFNIKKEVRSRGNTTNKSPFKSKPKTPIKAATPVKSTELQEQNCQNDSNQSFPCYFFKSNGVAMKFNFPLKHKLSEKTMQLLVERRKGFANVLSPMVDFRIKVSNLEDGYLTREIVEEYYEKQNSSDDQLNLCEVNAVDNSSPTPKKMKIFDNGKPKNNTASANLSPEPGVKTSVKQVNPKKILSPKLECGRNRKDSVSSPKRSKIRKSLDFELRSEVNDSGDSLSKTVEQNYLSSTGKNKSKSISLQKPPEHFKGFDEFELNENDFNKPNKMHFPNTPTNLQASGSSLPKRKKAFNAAKNTILKPSLKVMCDVESSNKTEKQSPNIPILKSVVKGSPIKNSNSLNRDGKIDENFNSPKSKISSRLEKCLRLNNIKPCKVVIVRLPENDNHLSVKTRSSRQKQKKKAPFPKPKQHNVVVNDRKLVDCSMPIENSWQVNQGVAVCSEKEFDTFQVPFDRFEVAETSSKIDVEDSHNLSKLVEENPIEFRLSVRLDRIDQSVFFRSNDKRDSFKIDNLDGSFGEDMETSSDDDVPITPSARKTDRNKACLSTPRPRYKPLKVKITKSPPRKVSKPLPQCWVLLNKLNFDDYKGSCSGSAASSSHCLAGYSKIRNPVDATSSHSHSHSGSDYCAIFGEGEVLSQPEPKKAVNLQLEPDEDDFEYLASSNLSQAAQDKTCQKVETNSEAIGLCSESIDEENINDQSFLNASENYDDSEKSSFPYRNALPVDPVTLKSKDTVDKYMSIPGPSTSSTQPWCNANVYGSDSSTDEKEDKGILSFYNTSVYFPENDSDSEKTIYEIVSLGDDSCEVSGEEYKTFIPKIEPPSHDGILSSLSQYGLTNVLNPEPFCSDLSDRASTEVGPVSLKLKSRTAIDLEEYDGPYSKGLCMYRNNLLKSLQVKGSSVLAGDREVSLIPLKRPPSCMQVKKWLKVKTQLEETKKWETEDKSEKVERLIVACSPGQDYGSDEEQNTLVLTPMSPPSRIHSTPSDCPPGASLFLTDTLLCTPVPLTPGRRTKRKSSDILKKSSAKLLKNYAAMSSMSQENEADAAHAQKEELELQLSDSSICISEETRNNMEAELKKKARLSCSFQIEACNNSDSTSSGLPTRIDNLQKTRPQIQHQYLTLMFLELHVQTRGDLLPDPENDAIRAVFYHFVNDVPEQADNITMLTGIIAVGHLVAEDETVSVTCVSDEMALLVALVQLIRKWDPDMFIGYEIEKLSWGYLIERAYTVGMNLNVELSRVMGAEGAARHEDEQGMLAEDIRLAGRIVLNVWRLMRHETWSMSTTKKMVDLPKDLVVTVALQSYTFENMMYHVLRRRIPLFSFRSLSAWWEHRTQLYRWMTVEHYLVRVRGVAEIVDHLDLIGRTSELARLFGIQFYEVLSRGSQFRVESMMLRMAKPENYVAVSPTTKQRAHMRAPESLPLIMEPESRFYADPVIVLDFQSLYPSIIIAYNYCFSTCLGRVENLAKSELFNFGCTHLRVPFSTVNKLEENLNYSPCGVAFVNSSIRRGVLPRMLQEILETRLMVKRSMKKNKNNKALHKVLHNRQLGLKLIANVTYGYTSANFSGRMPCIEIGDSVVSKGRETLERAIALVNKTEKWGARVVYGDTDSLFVLVPGRSRADAFRIGAEIAEAVTAENPKPVKLKLEKVYQPCILQTKKRYVGHMWESPDQETPTYDAKGIETVRRDGCPAVAKILQKSLQLLFETKDVSIVKRFILHQFGKVSSGRISIQELTFAREYRGARGYKPGACVPALELARSWLKKDRRSEPPVGERVPYVVVAGPPGLPLIRLVRSPRALLADPALKINADYYITRVIIPPLNRCLLLVSADALNWFKSMPRRQAPSLPSAVPSGVKKATISQYFATVTCAVCHEHNCTTGICDYCQARPQTVAVSLATQLNAWERRRHLVIKACQSCCRRSTNIDCISLDCPVLYARADADRQLTHEPVFRKLQHEYFDCDF